MRLFGQVVTPENTAAFLANRSRGAVGPLEPALPFRRPQTSERSVPFRGLRSAEIQLLLPAEVCDPVEPRNVRLYETSLYKRPPLPSGGRLNACPAVFRVHGNQESRRQR